MNFLGCDKRKAFTQIVSALLAKDRVRSSACPLITRIAFQALVVDLFEDALVFNHLLVALSIMSPIPIKTIMSPDRKSLCAVGLNVQRVISSAANRITSGVVRRPSKLKFMVVNPTSPGLQDGLLARFLLHMGIVEYRHPFPSLASG